jgi:hypothetical protein
VSKVVTVSVLSNGGTFGWTADQDYILDQAVNYGGGNVIVHIDPDQTYASWAAALADGFTDQFFLFIRGNAAVADMWQIENINLLLNKGQKIFISAETTTILGLFLSRLNEVTRSFFS